MGVTDAFAHKRQLLVEALATCAEVATREHGITIDTLRSLFKSAMPEWWREGELKLDPAWKMLCNQPGLTPQTVAPPMLLLRSFETTLDVKIRLPDALTAIPPGEQERLLESIPEETRAGIAKAIERAKLEADQAAAQEALRDRETTAQRQAVSVDRMKAVAKELPKDPAPVQSDAAARAAKQQARKKIAFVLMPVSLVAVGLALFLTLRPTATPLDLTPQASILKVSNAKRDAKSLTAVIADPKWNASTKENREKIARELLEALIPQSISVITLLDENERVKAVVYLVDSKINVVMR